MYYKLPTDEEMKILDTQQIQTHWVKVEVLDLEELPIAEIQGKINIGGAISIDSSSSTRRTTTFSFIADEGESNIEDVNNLLSINKRIRVFEGIENDGILPKYDKIIWIPQGIFIITQPSISYSTSGLVINLSCKDKMCLLNGECGGSFPTSITFHEYDQVIGYEEIKGKDFPENYNNYTVYKINGKYYHWESAQNGDMGSFANGYWEECKYNLVGQTVPIQQRIYDIIQTVVCNYGGIPISKIFINDVNLEIKQLVRFTGVGHLYYNVNTGVYSLDDTIIASDPNSWRVFSHNEDVGYVYTDFVYPGELVTAIGDNVCTVLDKIIEVLGNYEYFFDKDGNFVFQEIKNYLNNSYDPSKTLLDSYGKVALESNGLAILDNTNYLLDIKSNTKQVYNFYQGNGLISSYSNSPNFGNIKNDYHIWGKAEDKAAIHYHVAIKRKPQKEDFGHYEVVYMTDDSGAYTGRIRLLCDVEKEYDEDYEFKKEILQLRGKTITADAANETVVFVNKKTVDEVTHTLKLEKFTIDFDYVPADWRAELYLRGLTKISQQIRPDVYEQELLDLFNDIYDFQKKEFKVDIVTNPNGLSYFFDYLEPADDMFDYSIDCIGPKLHSYQQEKIKKLYSVDVPNLILINLESSNRDRIISKCASEGQSYSNVSNSVFNTLSIGTYGYSAQETMRDLLYQHTSYNESISLTTIPIYHLDVNTRITVNDYASNIHGDYIIKNISLPLGGQGTMTISATRALERI